MELQDLVIEEVGPPYCPHGPTLLFSPIEKDDESNSYGAHHHNNTNHNSSNNGPKGKKRKRGSERQARPVNPYYACSASRDLDFCSMKMDHNRWLSLTSKRRAEHNSRQLQESNDFAEEYRYLLDDEKKFGFCHDCCRVLVNADGIPQNHRFDLHLSYRCSKMNSNLDRSYFSSPTKLMTAATANQGQAQYFFDDAVAPFVIDSIIVPNGFRKVLCIGCPSIHEQVLARNSPNLSSFLLDIDVRFSQFYTPNQFVQFNMFNYYFFSRPGAEERLRAFLRGGGKASSVGEVIIVIDPPFGGRVEFLAESVRQIQHLMTGATSNDYNGHSFLPILLFFPYFNEHWIKRGFMDQLKITDFIVHYSNHGKFKQKGGGANKGGGGGGSQKKFPEPASRDQGIAKSPVRMFTNLDRSKIDLSLLNEYMREGNSSDPFYRWCSICERYIFKLNRHCEDCGECPARDASKPYGHCPSCQICIKSTWSHCANCNRCHLANKCKSENLQLQNVEAEVITVEQDTQ